MLVAVPEADDVHAHLGQHAPSLDACENGLRATVRLLAGYCRGRGFELVTDTDAGIGGTLPEDLWAVIVSVTARSLTNPTARRSETFGAEGDFTEAKTHAAPAGFTLPETATLRPLPAPHRVTRLRQRHSGARQRR